MVPRTREDARREALEQQRSRPRSSDDPSLLAHFIFRPETLREGVTGFLDLASRLVDTNRFVKQWRQVRTPAEHEANTGLDIIAQPEEFYRLLRSTGDDDTFFTIETTAFSSAIPKPDPRYYTASLSYGGGTTRNMNNQLSFSGSNYVDPPEHTLTLQEWINVITQVVAWRTPIFVAVGSRNYPIYDAVFDHRAWPGWLAWFPTRIDPQSLPGYALTFDIGPGTLVATQESNVITTDPAQVERANEVEMALAQLGVLPTLDELLGRGL